MTLGQNIQAARKAKGLSQEALADQVGVSRQALGKWEKDTALPSLDNLRTVAAVLDVRMDELLGAAADPGGKPEPTLTLDNLRALLEARDAQKQRRTRLWGGAALGVAALLLCVMIGVAYQYDRQVQTLQQSYAAMQANFSATQSELAAQIEELQAAVRQGKATVLDWGWAPTGRVVRDLDGTWAPVSVWVRPRTATEGMTGQLVVTHRGGRYDGTTELVDLDSGADGIYRVPEGLIFRVEESVELSVQWKTAAGIATNENLGTVECTEDTFRPLFYWSTFGESLTYGYRTQKNGKQTMLTLTHYPVELELDCPAWMQVQSVEVELRLDGAAGEPAAVARLESLGSSESGDRYSTVWNGTFWEESVQNGWPYEGGAVSFVARVTDSGGNVWTNTMPLSEKP